MLSFEDWGQVDYALAHQQMLDRVDKVITDASQEAIIFCEHPAVVTLGRQSAPNEAKFWKGNIVQIKRGGKATFHGPGQLVIYPLLRLDLRGQDIGKLLRGLEQSVLTILTQLKIEGGQGNLDKNTGVWVQNKKVASIGIAVKRWVSYHGMSINLDIRSLVCTQINPCGFEAGIMSCVENFLPTNSPFLNNSTELSLKDFFKIQLKHNLNQLFRLENQNPMEVL